MSNHQVLNSADHSALRIHTQPGAAFGDRVMACLTVPIEFRQVQAHYPIVFRRDIETGKLSALALFGFENGENLCLSQVDQWPGYRPLAMAIHPFLIGRAGADGQAQVHVDLDHARISTNGEGMRVFDDQGHPTPYLEAMAEKLGDLDHGYQNSDGFFVALERYALLEPFTLEVPLNDGSKQSLVGFLTIDETRLAALEPEVLHRLQTDGHLLPIFMALASLSQFSKLVALKNEHLAGG